MTDPVKLDSPFAVGDLVQPRQDCDARLLFHGQRTPPAPIVRILEYGGHVVREPDGREFPYSPVELEKAGD